LSRSLTINKIGINRKPVRDFLLVANSNLSRISDRLPDIETKMTKMCGVFSPFLPTSVSFQASQGVSL